MDGGGSSSGDLRRFLKSSAILGRLVLNSILNLQGVADDRCIVDLRERSAE